MNSLLPSLLVVLAGLGLRAEPPRTALPPVSQDAFTPGPEHELLLKSVGNWDAVVVTTDDKGVEQKTKGTLARTKETGFHTVDDFDGTFMGMPFTGHGTNGYCAVKKQYYQLWTDGMTSSPMVLYGDYDAAKKTLTLKGECVGMSGGFEPCWTVTSFPDADHMQWAMFGKGPDGKDVQMLRIDYTRKK